MGTLYINGVAPEVTCNKTLEKIMVNGTEIVWQNATPFVLSIVSYPLEFVSGNGGTYTCTTSDDKYEVQTRKSTGAVAFGTIVAQTPDIPTQNCNKVKITYSADEYIAEAKINDTVVTGSGTLILDVGDTFALKMELTSERDDQVASLCVTKVEFYKE